MKLEEAWQEFRQHMGIPEDSMAHAVFYAGYIAGAHEIASAANETCLEVKAQFLQRVSSQIRNESDEQAREAKPS